MINEKFIEKSSLCGRNYLLVDLELLQREELAQRRKLRIQQVRLQAKDLATRVLQDVRNERKLHLKTIQNKQADVFKKWQSRKLHEINSKYKENINAGQRAAAELPDPEEEILQQIKKNTAIAQERGKKAITQLKTGKEILRCEQEKILAQRDKVRTLETIRSAMVSSLSYGKNKRKPDQKSSNEGERAGTFSHGMETQLAEIAEEDDEESDEALMRPVVPGLCLDTSTERRSRKEPVSSSKKAASATKAPPPSVEVYDHHNPCTITQRQPPTVRVERTSLHSQTNAREAAEMVAKEEEAERQVAESGAEDDLRIKRGKKALVKELVRRDFDRLVTRLDGLAREERLTRVTELPKLPPETYMNEERTAMKIWKQQQDLESAFEGVLHGNSGANLRKDPHQSKYIGQTPLVVEQANFPEKLKLDSKDSETSLQKLNVGICSHVSTPDSSGYEVDTSLSSSHSSANVGDAESNEMEHGVAPIKITPVEKLSERTDEPQPSERASGDVCDAEEEMQRRIKTARLLLEDKEDNVSVRPSQKQIDEDSRRPMDQDDRGSSSWWCSFTSGRDTTHHAPPVSLIEEAEDVQEKCKTRRKVAVFKHSFEMKGKTLEELALSLQKRKEMGVSLDTNETTSSTSSSSWRLEEVNVVVKVDGQSLDRESSDKEEGSISKPDVISEKSPRHPIARKERKKKRKPEEIHSTRPKEFEDKPPKQDKSKTKFPDAIESRETKEKVQVASQGTQVGKDSPLKTDRKKRERKDIKKQRLGLQPPLSDSSYLSPPSHQDLSDADQAKALLEEIRSQRRRLEKWVGLKEHKKESENCELGDYIQRLLSMTRGSVAELSVSDVSTPTIQQSSPISLDASPVVEMVAVPLTQKKCEDKSVGTSFDSTADRQETLTMFTPAVDRKKMSTSPRSGELFPVDIPDLRIQKSLEEMKLSATKFSQLIQSESPKRVISPVVVIPEHHFRPPSPPPPSPEYDQLSVLHSKRISQLGAKLTEIREMQKRLLLTSSNSSGSESYSSHSPSTASTPEEDSSSSGRSDRRKGSEGSSSTESDGRRKSWEVLLEECNIREATEAAHVSAVDDQDSEDSLLEKLLLESVHLSETKKSFKPSLEMKAAQKYGSAKAGPPPTAMRGGTWIGSDFQIPHELSTIVEVDSKILSTTSLAEQKKDRDLATCVAGMQHQPEPLEDLLKAPELNQLRRVRSLMMTANSTKDASDGLVSERKLVSSPVNEKSFAEAEVILPLFTNVRISAEISEPKQHEEEEEQSDASLPMSWSSLDESSGLPENVDAALRMLGISPTVLERRKTPVSKEASPFGSPHSTDSSRSPPRVICSTPGSPGKDKPVASSTVDVGGGDRTNLQDQEVKESVTSAQQQKSWLQFTPLGSFRDLSLGTSSFKSQGTDRSAGKEECAKEMDPEQSNSQSTPIGSLRDFTFGSGSSSSVSEAKSIMRDSVLRAALRNMGASLMEQESPVWREKSSPGHEKSDQGSPIISKETPQSMLKHSTPLHSFSGEGSLSVNSEERRKGQMSFGDSAPSSISGGNTSG